MVEDECCEHIKDIIKARREKQRKHTEKFAAAFESAPERFYKAELARAKAAQPAQAEPAKRKPGRPPKDLSAE
jgi:hypothetical protein